MKRIEPLTQTFQARISIVYHSPNKKIAEITMKALQVDHTQLPPGLSIEMRTENNTLSIEIENMKNLRSFRATVDDLLMAKRMIETLLETNAHIWRENNAKNNP